MTTIGAISFGCVALTGALATWAVFSKHYDDNLVQRAGLIVLALACFLRLPGKIADPDGAPVEVVAAQIGLVLYGVGTAWRIWRSGHGSPMARRGEYRRHVAGR